MLGKGCFEYPFLSRASGGKVDYIDQSRIRVDFAGLIFCLIKKSGEGSASPPPSAD
jgi:hypothetical protein